MSSTRQTALVAGVVSLLSLVNLRQHLGGAAGANAAALVITGAPHVAIYNWIRNTLRGRTDSQPHPTLTLRVLVCSVFPALSTAKNLIVSVCVAVSGVWYTGLDVPGAEPSTV
jgi:hypothetical protein